MASSYPLHDAAKARMPEEELLQLLEENPGAAMQMDDSGRLPLHHAASSLLPPLGHGTLRALIEANPGALLAPEDTPDRNLPLHLAATNRNLPLDLMELLLEGTRGLEAASTKNSCGRLPLHLAAEHNAPLEVIRALIDANPEALLQGDRYLDLPLHLHCASSQGGNSFSSSSSADVVALLLEGRGHKAAATKDLYSCLPIHFAAEWRAPPESLRALIEANPSSLLEGDGLNRTPLHIHCASPNGQASAEGVALLLGGRGREAAAKRDLLGRLPLHWAAESRAPLEALRALIEANPEALLAGDVVKGTVGPDIEALLKGGDATKGKAAGQEAAPEPLLEEDVIKAVIRGPNRLPLHLYCASTNGEASAEAVALLLGEERGREAAAWKDSGGSLPLHLAAEQDLPPWAVRALIEANPEGVLTKGRDSKLPIHCAAEFRASAEVVALLLLHEGTASGEAAAAAAPAAAKDAGGRLPLHLAAEKGAPLGSLRALIDAYPAALLEEDTDKNLPLHCAAWGQASAEAVALLLEGTKGLEAAARKESRGRFPLHLAAQNRSPFEAVRALIDACPSALLEGDLHMILPLHYAVSGHDASLEVVKLLLEGRGREAVATKSMFDRLPLHWAAENQAPPEVVGALIEANPEGLLQGAVSNSLPLHLHLASWGKASPDVVALLLNGKGREAAFKKDMFERFPLHLAAEWRAPAEVVRALLEINPGALLATDRRSSLPLHLHCSALGEASAGVLAVLLEGRGREVAAVKDGRGLLPLHLLARDNSVSENKAPLEAFRALIEANPAALLVEGADKDLPIHIYLRAVRSQASAEVVALLLEGSGRETAARKGSRGCLPLHLAADRRAPLGAVKVLLEAYPGALTEGDGKGNLPGDLAKRARAPEEVVALLSPPAAAE